MSIQQKTAGLFVVDCSFSSATPRDFVYESGESTVAAPIDLAKRFVTGMIAQRIMRDLKSLPVGVLTYAAPRTKNILTQQLKERAKEEGEGYNKHEDQYRSMYEHISFTTDLRTEMMSKVDEIVAGEGPDSEEGSSFTADAHGALILANSTYGAAPTTYFAPKYTREVFLLTDGESESNWDREEETAQQFAKNGLRLVVIGFNFDDEDTGYKEEGKSTLKRQNEAHLHTFVSNVNAYSREEGFNARESIVTTLSDALNSLALPNVKVVKSVDMPMTLTIGSRDDHPDTAITIQVNVKKATVPAPNAAMKKYSMKGYVSDGKSQAERDREIAERRRKALGVAAEEAEEATSSRDNAEVKPTIPTPSAFGPSEAESQGGPASFGKPSTTANDTSSNGGPRRYENGDIGRTLDRALLEAGLTVDEDAVDADLMDHGTRLEKSYRYRPLPEEEKAKEKEKEEAKKEREARRIEREGMAMRENRAISPDSGEEDEEDEDGGAVERMDQWQPAEETNLKMAYAYGGEFVSSDDMKAFDAGVLAGLRTGMEVMAFVKMDSVHLEQRLGDVYYVLPTIGQIGSNLTFSAFINAMHESKRCAIVRFVGRSMNKEGREIYPDPRVGIMWPVVDEGIEYCWWCRMPFAEDMRRLEFPSLRDYFDRKKQRLGPDKCTKLPTQEQMSAMDDFVDSMDLMTAGPADEDGNPTEWFTCADSYNPALHNISNALTFRLTYSFGPLPSIPTEITKYLDPPATVIERSETTLKRLRDVMDVKFVPSRPKKTKKTANISSAADAPSELLDSFFPPAAAGSGAEQGGVMAMIPPPPSKPFVGGSPDKKVAMDVDEEDDFEIIEPSTTARQVKAEVASQKAVPVALAPIELLDDSEDEPDTEDDEEDGDATVAAPAGSGVVVPSPKLNEQTLLEDFARVLKSQGVEGAVPAMVSAVQGMVKTSFSTQKYDQALRGLKQAREEAKKASSPKVYNAALTSLVKALRITKNTDFIPRIEEEGVGLIVGGSSGGATEAEAVELLA